MHVMNEYMAVDDADGNAASRPSPTVITTLSPRGRAAERRAAARGHAGASILHVPKEIIPLSASVLDPTVYPVVEKAMGIEIASYALSGNKG